MTCQIKICSKGKPGGEKALTEAAGSSQEWWPSALDTLAPMTHYCLAPHGPSSSSLTPIQQFSILLLQFISCPEQTLLLLLFNVLLTSCPWKSPFFSLSSCFTVAQDQLIWPTGISPLSEHQLYLTLYHPLEGYICFWQSRRVEPA